MLIEFRVENHRSLRDEQALTLEAHRGGEADDERPRQVGAMRLLPCIGLYGANASGKSNVLKALDFMRDAVRLSHRRWAPDGGVPRDPFGWGERRAEPSLFEVKVLIEGVVYEYGFVADDEAFLEEWLFAWPKGRRQVWFEREKERFKFGEHLRGENRVVEQVTRPNALFLSSAAQLRHEQLSPLFRWFRELRSVSVRGFTRFGWRHQIGLVRWLSREASQGDLFEPASGERRAAFRELLEAADVGVVDLKILEDDGVVVSDARFRGPRVVLRHRGEGGGGWLPLEEESNGTQVLLSIAPAILDVLLDGGVLLLDELEASLHPLLALQVLRLFNSPTSNPKNAQMLFTTHDTTLLGGQLAATPLRRDQVWLTEKDREGATRLYPLTDYKPRKAENLERGYLQGRYGGVPYLGELLQRSD